MAFCSKCGEKMEEIITYTKKTHKQNGSEFHCSVHGVDKNPIVQHVKGINPHNKACRDWGTILKI
jgi:hypothetical protein